MTGGQFNPFKDDMTGRVLLSKYRIVRKLAAGGMGVVYLARSEGAAGFVKPVVVKIVLPSFASSKDFVGMFIREARILAELQDPGIVNVIDFAQEGEGYIMVLEYVHGFQLREWIRFLRSKRRRIPTPVAIQIVINVLDALHHAHKVADEDGNPMHIVHRDISPTNILIDIEGRTKLCDFGIALMATEGYKTQNQSFKGKLSYAAPELFTSEKATVLSDVYACGVTMHELLVGRNEFHTKNHATTIQRVLNHAPSSVRKVRPDAPQGIDTVIQKALAKNPQNRYQDSSLFATALRKVNSVSEREAMQMLSEMVRRDFDVDMAQFLKVESLQARDRAWRNPSEIPAAVTADVMAQSKLPVDPADPATVVVGQSGTPAEMDLPAAREPSEILSSPLEIQQSFTSVKRTIVGGTVVLALIVAGIITFFMFKDQGGEDRKFLLVESPTVAVENGEQPETIPQVEQPTQNDTEVTAAPDQRQPDKALSDIDSPPTKGRQHQRAKKTKPTTKKPPASKGPNTAAITAAFKKKKGKIHACFINHPDDLSGQPKLSINFHISTSGQVEKAVLSSKRLTTTKLGGCLLRVAQSTKFPPQDERISFRIPVTISRVKEQKKL